MNTIFTNAKFIILGYVLVALATAVFAPVPAFAQMSEVTTGDYVDRDPSPAQPSGYSMAGSNEVSAYYYDYQNYYQPQYEYAQSYYQPYYAPQTYFYSYEPVYTPVYNYYNYYDFNYYYGGEGPGGQ